MRAIIATLFLVGLLLVSCSLIPENSLENLMNPNVEYSVVFRIPVLATSLELEEILKNSLEDALDGVLDFELLETDPVVLRVSTDLLSMNLSDELSLDSSATFEIPGISVPELEDLVFDIEANLPEMEPQTLDVPVEFLPGGESSFSGRLEINLGITEDVLESFTVEGHIGLGVELPSSWNDVRVLSITARLFDGSGDEVVEESFAGGAGLLNLNGIELNVGDGEIELEISVVLENGGGPTEGIVKIHVDPDFEVRRLNGWKVGFSKLLTLPRNVVRLTFKDGRIVFSSRDLEFLSVDSQMVSESGVRELSVLDGNLILDLEGLTLPATFVLRRLDAMLKTENPESIEVIGEFEDAKRCDLTIHSSDLVYSGEHRIGLSESGVDLKELHLSRGSMDFQYESDLPVALLVHVVSDQMEPRLDETLEIRPGSGVLSLDLSDRNVLPDEGLVILSYEVEPQGYHDGYLDLEDVEFGARYTFNSTVTLGNLEIDWIRVGKVEFEKDGTFDLGLGGVEGFLKALSYSNMETELPSTSPVDGVLTLEATFLRDGTSSSKRAVLRLNESDTSTLTEIIRDFMRDPPRSVLYRSSLKVVDSTIPDGFSLGFALNIPLEVELPSSILVMEFSTDVQLSEMVGILDEATIFLEGTNTSSLKPEMVLNLPGRSEIIPLGEEIEAEIPLREDDLAMLSEGRFPLNLGVYISGKQSLNPGGVVELRVKMEARIRLTTGGGGE